MSRPNDIPPVEGLTLEKILGHWLYDTATDEEIAYSANCSVQEVRAAKRKLAQRRNP